MKFLLCLLILSLNLFAADDKATISLQKFKEKLVVSVHHDEGWHTYWKNPGDSGLASSFKFFSADKKPLKLKEFEWPIPEKHLEAGDILTIGYEGIQHFFFEAPQGKIDAHITVLICKDICIPGEAKLTLQDNQDFISSRPRSPYTESELHAAFEKLPKDSNLPEGFEYYLTRVKDQNLLTLHYSYKINGPQALPAKLNLLTPFPAPPFGYKRETLFADEKTIYGKTEIEWDGEYQEPPVALSPSGSFEKPYELSFLLNLPGMKNPEKVSLKIKDFSLASPSLDSFYKKLTPFDGKKTPTIQGSAQSGKGLLNYLLLAFLGGLILNLMPCVLPVISIKLFGIIKHQNLSRPLLMKHNFSYTAGVLATFMALAGVIVTLKSQGEEVGWGFQLQSPAFVLIMMMVLFIMALNLFGLFEFKTPGGSKLGNTQLQEGFVGDFFSGVLTTILSTPCSAPFLGTALAFAFTVGNGTIFLMFIAIGLGLAFPFLMTALFPASLRLLPRPGLWMEKLKYFLGLSLLITVVWLYDVFVSLVNFEVISWRLNLLFAVWFFSFFFIKKISSSKFFAFTAFLLPITLTYVAVANLELKTTENKVGLENKMWQSWSEEKLTQEKGQWVFMDFTAEWCLTCKVNKKLVLETDSFQELSQKKKLTLLRADWTKRDDHITQFLKRYGAISVPAYFLQKPDGTILFLGETISLDKIEKNLN
jgi:thiol:disulfide interchange protein